METQLTSAIATLPRLHGDLERATQGRLTTRTDVSTFEVEKMRGKRRCR
jgi:hypothetical protein